MNIQKPLTIAFLLLLALPLTPSATALASTYTEGFENRSIGQLPANANWYTYQTDNSFTGSNSIVDGSAFGGGSTRAFSYHPSTTSTGSATYFTNHIPTLNPCGLGGDGAVFETDFILHNPSATTNKHFWMGLLSKNKFLDTDTVFTSASTPKFALELDYGATTATALGLYATDTSSPAATALSGVSLTYGTSYHVAFAMSCGTSTTFTIVLSGYSPFVQTVGGATTAILDDFAMIAVTNAPVNEDLTLDNLKWTVKTRLVSTTYDYGALLEDFNAYNVGDVPASPTYTLTYTPNGATFAGVQQCTNLGSQCVSTNTGGTLDFQYLGTKSLCSSTDDFSYEVGATMSTTPTQADIQVGIQDVAYPGTPNNAVYWSLFRQSSTTAAVHFTIIKNGVTTTTVPYGAAQFDVRLHDFAHITCTGGNIFIKGEGGASSSVAGTFTAPLRHFVVKAAVIASGANQNAYVDNINWPVSALLPAPPVPTNTYTVADAINGFDLSRSGEFAITRESVSGLDTVRFLNGVNLGVISSETTNCNRLQGVVALQDDGAAFLKCNPSSAADVQNMRLVDKFLDPITGGECLRNDDSVQQLCDGTINIDSSTIDEDNLLTLGTYYPTIVNLQSPHAAFNNEVNYFVLSGTHTNGKVSELLLGYSYYRIDPEDTASSNSPQNAEIAHENEVSFSGAGDALLFPHSVCTSQIDRNFIASSNNAVGQFDFTDNTNTASVDENPPAIRAIFSRTTAGNSLSDGAEAIDCNSGMVGWLTDSTVGVFNRNTGTNLWTLNLPAGGAGAQAVTMSDFVVQSGVTRGPFMAYSFDEVTHIVNASSGVELAQIPNPVTGANGIRELGIDNVAQRLYLNDKFHVYRYDIHALTTVTPAGVGDGGGCILNCDPINGTHTQTSTTTGTGSSTTVIAGTTITHDGGFITGGPAQNTGNPLGNAVQFFNTSWGFDGTILFGLLITASIGIFIARISHSIIITAAGLLIGIVVAYMLGLMPLWVIVVIVFLIIAIAGHKMFGRGSSDDDGGSE